MNKRLEDYLRDVERSLGHLSPEERQGIVKEMRSHLEDEIDERMQEDPAMGRTEATERALLAFGEASELGVSFQGTSGPAHVVNRNTGQVLLSIARATGRAAKATGRGLGLTLKWILIVGLVVVCVSLATALVLIVVFQDDIREAAPRPHYNYGRTHDSHTGTDAGAFSVGPDTKEIRISIVVDRYEGLGCATIQVIDPSGRTVFDNTGQCDDQDTLLTFTDQGTWQVRYTFADFTGRAQVNVFSFERA